MKNCSLFASDGSICILWDMENCPVPNDVRPEDVAGNIRMALRAHPIINGSVNTFSAYGDFNGFSRRLREGCQRTGVKLIDVPNGRKDAADKAILIDMFLFALDNPPPSSIMLISGDVDFSPALHVLGQRGYTVILVVPSGVGVSSALSNGGSYVWDWSRLVRGDGFVPPSRSKNEEAEPEDLIGLKSQLVKLLELSGGRLLLRKLPCEYQKSFGRPLSVSDNNRTVKLLNLLKNTKDVISVENQGQKKLVLLKKCTTKHDEKVIIEEPINHCNEKTEAEVPIAKGISENRLISDDTQRDKKSNDDEIDIEIYEKPTNKMESHGGKILIDDLVEIDGVGKKNVINGENKHEHEDEVVEKKNKNRLLRNPKQICKHCGMNGHSILKCFKLLGFPIKKKASKLVTNKQGTSTSAKSRVNSVSVIKRCIVEEKNNDCYEKSESEVHLIEGTSENRLVVENGISDDDVERDKKLMDEEIDVEICEKPTNKMELDGGVGEKLIKRNEGEKRKFGNLVEISDVDEKHMNNVEPDVIQEIADEQNEHEHEHEHEQRKRRRVKGPEVTLQPWNPLILKSETLVLVEFYTSWCGPYQMVHEVVNDITTDYAGKLTCVAVDIDQEPQVMEEYDIQAVPIVLLFKNGQKCESLVGSMSKDLFVAAIERVLAT